MGQDESKALFGKPREEIELFFEWKTERALWRSGEITATEADEAVELKTQHLLPQGKGNGNLGKPKYPLLTIPLFMCFYSME